VNPKIRFPLEDHLEELQKLERQAVEEIEKAVAANPDDIAGLIIEPIQGEGGDNHFRPEFFKKLRVLADEHEFLFILDEVQTGVGLTGKMWAYQHYDVKPDILAFGKKTQVCGILAGPRIDEVEKNVFRESSRLNSTWGGNLVDMVRFGRYLEIIEAEGLVENARETGGHLLRELSGVGADHPEQVENVRGRGLMCAFDLADADTRDEFQKLAIKNGMLVLGCGRRSIRFRPSLSVNKSEIDQGVEIIRRILSDLG
jgi:L-lysine 6-transaminase